MGTAVGRHFTLSRDPRGSPLGLVAALLVGMVGAIGCGSSSNGPSNDELVAQGKQIFRFDTFGDETKWTDALRMNEVISTVEPTTALTVGLKVDSEALPASVVTGIQNGSISLTDPATTLALLKLDAVVGVKATVTTVNGTDTLTRVGITCALCHSTVDDSFTPGVGKRLDGWPNRDLNVGAIVALSPALDEATKAIFNSWGPGRYDPRFNLDGKNGPQEIPPAYGLQDVHSVTVTGDGTDLAYWNRYVAVTQMGGQGAFKDPRLGIDVKPQGPDLVKHKLPALKAYQHSLANPAPRAGSFDAAAAQRGREVFAGAARCASCHSGPAFTDDKTHAPEETGMEATYAARSATKRYRTTPLRALWQHAPYFHDGSAADLTAVVDHYAGALKLSLTPQQKKDLVEYLKSI